MSSDFGSFLFAKEKVKKSYCEESSMMYDGTG